MNGLNFSFFTNRTPMIFQGEASECALACLLMIMHHYGNKTKIQTARKRFDLGNQGVTIVTLKLAAEKVNLQPRIVQIDLDDLRKLPLPAILHWDLRHFVVLTKLSRKGAIIHDPAVGIRQIGWPQLSQSFTGVALELYPAKEFKTLQKEPSFTLNNLIPFLRGLEGSMYVCLSLSIFAQLFILLFPLFYHTVIDRVINHGDADLLTVIFLFFIGLAIFHLVSNVLRAREEMYLASNLIFRSTTNTLKHLFSLPLRYFESRKISSIMSRVTATRSIEKVLCGQLLNTIVDSGLSLFIVVILLIYNLQLTLAILVSIVVYFIAAYLYYKRISLLEREGAISGAEERVNLSEALNTIQTTKLYANEREQLDLWQKHYADSVNTDIQITQAGILYRYFTEFIFSLSRIVLIYLAARLALGNQFTIGELFAIFLYGNILMTRVQNLTNVLINLKTYGIRHERIQDILLEEPEQNKQKGTMKRDIKGDISLENLTFKYSSGEKSVFGNVNVTIAAGEIVAIIGPSGCGKSTLLKVMLGLYQPTKGAIFYDKKRLAKLDITHFRKQIATVMQDDTIIAGTIAKNIALYDSNPDYERIREVSAHVMIDGHIESLPMKYETQVHQGGGTLSGGQRQRVLLARALYKRPKILFMDESTAFLDIDLEAALISKMKELQITQVVVAHRFESVRMADRVLVFKDGTVKEERDYFDSPSTKVNSNAQST